MKTDAIRRVKGVVDAKQYTIPVDEALERVRNGENPTLTTREKHTRECFVVAEEGADLARIEREIKEMPNYFADYDTTVHFISLDELKEKHSGIPHGGFVINISCLPPSSPILIRTSNEIQCVSAISPPKVPQTGFNSMLVMRGP